MKEVKPLIVSASRRTDIPAFYMDWFILEWNKGWTEWTNPFNPNQKKLVSFENTQLVVFWSKYPLGILRRLKDMNFDFYLMYTVNDYPEFELNLPPLEKRIELFKKLSKILGPDRVIWRFDPLIFTSDTSAEDLLGKFERISRKLEGYTKRVIISVMSPYKKTVARMKKSGFSVREPLDDEISEIGERMKEISEGVGMEIQTCADRFWRIFESVGVRRGACIDPDYISKVFGKNKILVEGVKRLKKDKGQRELCKCVESVDIGKYNTCKFRCIYCYAL